MCVHRSLVAHAAIVARASGATREGGVHFSEEAFFAASPSPSAHLSALGA